MFSDLRFALRQLAKKPSFTIISVLTLALGIGVNTTMFSVLNALVLRPSAVHESSQVVWLFRTSPQSQSWPDSPGNFYDIQKQSASYERMASFYWNNYNLAEAGQPAQRLAGVAVTGEFFAVLGIQPELGRAIGPADDVAGSGQVAVLTDSFWRSHYAADPGVIGKVVRMDGQPVTIVGVMPASIEEPLYWGHLDLWRAAALDASSRAVRDNNWLHMAGRLKPGVSIGQAQSEATGIAKRLEHDFPQTNAQNGLRLVSWDRVRTDDLSRNISWLCMGLAGFVLLIACTNLANLQLARISERVREHAVRIALGASRLQLIRQLLVESVLLSTAGGVLGILVALVGTGFIGRAIYITGVAGYAMPVDAKALAFTLAASVVTGIAVGTLPAWIASRTDVNAALKQGSRGSTGDRKRQFFRQGLIVIELALALVLLSGAGFFVRGMQRVARTDGGWRPDGLLTATLSLPFNEKYATDAQCQAFFDKLAQKLSELPGATQSSIACFLPIVGVWQNSPIAIEGRLAPPHGKEPLAAMNPMSPGHFATLGIRLTSGRDFTSADRMDSRHVAIVNESMARHFWPGESALGKRIGDVDPANPNWCEIVGVAADVRSTLELVQAPDTPFLRYLPLSQTPSNRLHWLNLSIRSTAPTAVVAAALRTAVQEIDPDQPVYAIVTAREAMEQITNSFSAVSGLLAAFALIGLVLSAVGIYGVIANLVAQRTPEIGIRMALGAQVGDVLWMILGQGLKLAVVGTLVGLACAWGLVRLLVSTVPGVPGSDPWAIAGIASLLVSVAVFACWLPARRASKVDPVIALRAD
jgi:putative ABC transport system permease protein